MVKICFRFMQSFNRPNLKYCVLPKKKKSLCEDIIDRINHQYKGQSGIVYCLSRFVGVIITTLKIPIFYWMEKTLDTWPGIIVFRKECDEVADELRRAKIPALPYHAGLNDKERTEVQMRWIREDNCKVFITIFLTPPTPLYTENVSFFYLWYLYFIVCIMDIWMCINVMLFILICIPIQSTSELCGL